LLNTQPAQALAEQAERRDRCAGWRVFQDQCASCHGPAASGTSRAPDLLPRVQNMVSRQFVSLVLQRYEWTIPAGQPSSPGPARDALVEDMVQRKGYQMTMPAWQGEPTVNAHIVDLYAYLSARAQGTRRAAAARALGDIGGGFVERCRCQGHVQPREPFRPSLAQGG